MATKIQLRRDTAANWTSVNPTLSAGELGYETDTDKVKIGDGLTAWTSLTYLIDGTAGAETDPIVGAVSGIVKADGAGNISAASAGTDYQAPLTSGVDYQAPLVSGTSIKTINGSSILGSGDLTVAGSGGIALTDLSIGADAGASGQGGVAYDNTTGIFTYTPPSIPTDTSELTNNAGYITGTDIAAAVTGAATIEDLVGALEGLGV